MEFLGLLGLLGLAGFFSGRGINDKFENFRNEMQRNDKSADVANLQRQFDNLNHLLQNCASKDELNYIARQLQNELDKKISNSQQKNSAADSADLQNKITTLENVLEKFCMDFESRCTALENKKIPAPNDSAKIYEQHISQLEADNQMLVNKISTLESKLAEQNAVLAQWQSYFSQFQGTLNFLQQKFAEQTKLIEQLQKPPAKSEIAPPIQTESKIVPTATPLKSKILQINDFQLQKPAAPLFSNNPEDAAKTLAVIENLSPILNFLENSTFDKKNSFISLIKNYRQNLKKFSDKVKRQKFDEDSFSEEVSSAFFDTLSNYFLSKLPVAIYRGGNQNIFYAELLPKVNDYLAACHVYTELIEPKKFMQHDDIEKMTIVNKDTPLQDRDKLIDEVEQLPYYLDYLTGDDDLENFRLDGKMVVLKFDGGKK